MSKVGEARSKEHFIFSYEKRRQENKAVTSLLINGVEFNTLERLKRKSSRFIVVIFILLHTPILTLPAFLKKIENFIPKIDASFKEICESDLRIEELDAVSLKLWLNKSPDSNRLTADFYKLFWKDVRNLLFKALHECIERKELMPSMKQILITLIAKHGKDKRLLDNLRPITLLNIDYKFLSRLIETRMKIGLSR